MNIVLHQTDANAPQAVHVGDQVTVLLKESPTTGYRWQADYDKTRLTLVEDRFEGPDAPRGAGGDRVLVFEAQRSGPTTLKFDKRRDWGDTRPTDTFAIQLDVKPHESAAN
jgi:inhibitor of cysteine peptidase